MSLSLTLLISIIIATSHAMGPKACTRPHEHYECGSACQTTCATLGENCTIINVKCNDWCYCDDGYARDQTGNCVVIAGCPNRLNGICGPNEEYKRKTYYKDECSGQELSQGEIPNKRACGCYCKKGYKRHISGLCVPTTHCPYPLGWINCTRPNEVYACGSACQTRCDNYGEVCPIVNIRCNDACYCKEGYARITDDKSVCIRVKNCPSSSSSSSSDSN